MTTIGTGPCSVDIGDGIETFEMLADIQHATRARVTGPRSNSEWYRQLRSRHGATVRDAAGKVVANVSCSAPMQGPAHVGMRSWRGRRVRSRGSVSQRRIPSTGSGRRPRRRRRRCAAGTTSPTTGGRTCTLDERMRAMRTTGIADEARPATSDPSAAHIHPVADSTASPLLSPAK